MPVNVKEGESQQEYISRCMSQLAKTDSDRPQKQRAAMCYSKWREHSGDDIEDIIANLFEWGDFSKWTGEELIDCGCHFDMAKLTYKGRQKLPDSAFCGPDRSYPAHDAAHVRNGLARLSQNKGRYPSGTAAKILSCLRGRAKKFGVKVASSEDEDLQITWKFVSVDGVVLTEWKIEDDFALIREDGERLLQYKIEGKTEPLFLLDSLMTVDYLPHITDDEWKTAKTLLMTEATTFLEGEN